MARTGRPRSFDRDAALTDAMALFWQHGYEGTSLERLRREMGNLSSASLYAAFGSKEALYKEALQLYLKTHGQVLDVLADTTLPPRYRIERALRASARMQTEPGHPTGCMVTLSATIGSSESEALRAVTMQQRAANRMAIEQCVLSAVKTRELWADTKVKGLARMFDGLLNGLSIQARDGVTESELDDAIDAAMQAWQLNCPVA